MSPATRLESMLRRWRRTLAAEVDPDGRVHAARVALKEARAVVRLFRQGTGVDAVAWNRRLRGVMKALAPARDDVVVRRVLGQVAAADPGSAPAGRSRRGLARPDRRIEAALRRVDPLLDELVNDLAGAARTAGWKPLDAALARAMRRVRRLQEKAGDDADLDLWHRWRRRVKELAFQLDFVRPPDLESWPQLRRQAWRLQARLGDWQDHQVAMERVTRLGLPASTQAAVRGRLKRNARRAAQHAWRARLSLPKG